MCFPSPTTETWHGSSWACNLSDELVIAANLICSGDAKDLLIWYPNQFSSLRLMINTSIIDGYITINNQRLPQLTPDHNFHTNYFLTI